MVANLYTKDHGSHPGPIGFQVDERLTGATEWARRQRLDDLFKFWISSVTHVPLHNDALKVSAQSGLVAFTAHTLDLSPHALPIWNGRRA
jgi:hypothetical protein